ncbi:MAG: DNA primase [Candidatus Moraniibacteriota bacterium]
MPFSQNAPEEIKSRLNVVDVIGGYLKLEKSGAHYKANCPFHQERTPSFMVNEERNMWHCFGCNRGGDIFAFVMEMDGLSFREALVLLAERAGVELPQYRGAEAEGAKRDEKERLEQILDLSLRFYEKQLWEGPGRTKILPYLKKRGLSEDSIRTFRLGFAPDGWEHLASFLAAKGYTGPEMEAAGMALKKEGGTSVYDRFRSRVMFPIFDIFGRAVGFSARLAPGADESQAKYINTPETALYHKSRALYGLFQAKQALKQAGATVVVEGNMDVIAMHQAGIANTVAVSGTALTDEQLTLMKRYGKTVSLFFDMDGAGQAAARKSALLALGRELAVNIVALPSGKDAADMGAENPEALKQAVSGAVPALQYFLEELLKQHDTRTAAGKRAITEEYATLLAVTANPIERSHWTKRLAEKIGVDEKTILALVNSQSKPAQLGTAVPQTVLNSAPLASSRAERLREEVISSMYADRAVREQVLSSADEQTRDYLSSHPLFFFLVQSDGHDPLSLIESADVKGEVTRLMFHAWENPEIAALPEESKSAKLAELTSGYLEGLARELSHTERLHDLERDIRAAKERGDRDEERRLLAEFSKTSKAA